MYQGVALYVSLRAALAQICWTAPGITTVGGYRQPDGLDILQGKGSTDFFNAAKD